MRQRKLILFILILFILSSAYLLYASNKYQNLNFGSDYWTVCFYNPKSDELSFIIENHSDQTDFHWQVMADQNKIKEGEIKIANGAQSKISGTSPDFPDLTNKKITIVISAGEEKKEIYKN